MSAGTIHTIVERVQGRHRCCCGYFVVAAVTASVCRVLDIVMYARLHHIQWICLTAPSTTAAIGMNYSLKTPVRYISIFVLLLSIPYRIVVVGNAICALILIARRDQFNVNNGQIAMLHRMKVTDYLCVFVLTTRQT